LLDARPCEEGPPVVTTSFDASGPGHNEHVSRDDLASARPTRRGGCRARWLLWALLLALPVALALDATVLHWTQLLAPRGTVLRRVSKLCVHLFQWWSFVALAIVLLLPVARRRLLAGYAVCLAGGFGLLHAVKFLLGRARPDEDLGPLFFQPFSSLDGHDSFPSGHATQAVLLTALLGLYFPRSRWVLIPATLLVCFGRLALDRHYLSDVVGGAALALLVVSLAHWLLGPDYFPRLALSDLRRAPVGR